jgi:hypothetical protein
MDFLKSIGGKLATGLVVLAVFACGVAWFQASPESRSAVVGATMKIVGWTIAVLMMPWVGVLVVSRIEKFKSNAVSAGFILALTAVEATLLLWLFDFAPGGATAWTLALAGVLTAGVYNLFACDWIADKWNA